MKLQKETYNIQSDFAAYCRTGELPEIPGTKPDGLAQYRRLVYNVINDAIENSFPIAVDYLQRKVWDEMVHDFFSNHKCQSFQVWNIAGEFYHYAKEMNWAERYAIPLLDDLLQFEWTETEMYNMPDMTMPGFKPSGNFRADVPVFNPEFKILQLTYPVHKFNPAKALQNPAQYFVLAFRNREDGRIHFADLSVFRVWIIEQLFVYGKTLDQALVTAESIFGRIDEQTVDNAVLFLEYLHTKQFLIGFKPATSTN